MTKKIVQKAEEKKQQQLDRVSSSKRLNRTLASSKQNRKLASATARPQDPSMKESVVKQVQIKHEPEEEKEVSHKVQIDTTDKVVQVKSEFVKPLVKVET